MSITVQCPNADCGQVHKVKNKYAGLRCKCPACGEAMQVPGATVSVGATAPALSAPAARAEAPPAPEPVAERPVTIDFSLPEKTPSRPKDADDDMDDLLAAAMEETEQEAAAKDEVDAANGLVIEEEVIVAADEDGVVVAEEEVVAVADDEVLLGGEEAVEAAEVEEPAIEAIEEEAVAVEEEPLAALEEEPVAAVEEDEGIVVADEEEAVVAEEDAIVAEDDFEDLDEHLKGKKAPAKGKGKPADEDEDEDAIIAEDDLADLAPPPKKKAKGKALLDDEDDDEEGFTAARPKRRRGDDDEDDDEDNVRPLRGRRGDDEDEDELDEEDEEGGKKKGKFATSTAIALLVGVIGLFVICAFPFLGNSTIKASGGLGSSALVTELLKGQDLGGIREDKKVLMTAIFAVGAVVSAVGLFLAWRKGTVGVATMVTSYLGWLAAWFGLTLAVVAYGANLETLAKVKALLPRGPGGELALSIGTSLWVGWVGSALAIGAFTLAILDMHRRTWAKVVFLLLFLLLGGFVFLMWSQGRKEGGQAALRPDAVAVVRPVTP